MNSRDVLKALLKDGWYEVAQAGSHKQFKHPTKKGRVTLPHPRRDIPIGPHNLWRSATSTRGLHPQPRSGERTQPTAQAVGAKAKTEPSPKGAEDTSPGCKSGVGFPNRDPARAQRASPEPTQRISREAAQERESKDR